MVGRTRPRGHWSGGEVEGVRLRDVHEIHEISMVKGWRGKEVGAVEHIFAVRCVGINHGGCDARVDLQERRCGATQGSRIGVEERSICIVEQRVHQASEI